MQDKKWLSQLEVEYEQQWLAQQENSLNMKTEEVIDTMVSGLSHYDGTNPTLSINSVPTTTGTININPGYITTWQSPITSDPIYFTDSQPVANHSYEQHQINDLKKEVASLQLQLDALAEIVKPLIERHHDLNSVREFINS